MHIQLIQKIKTKIFIDDLKGSDELLSHATKIGL